VTRKSSRIIWQRVIQAASLITATVALVAAILAYRASEHGVGAQYVAIAANILNPPSGQSDSDLRAWAVDLINKYSDDVPLPPKAAAALKAGKIKLYGVALAGEAKDSTRAEGTLTVKPSP
jgi:uncharacterized membrane protein